MSVADAPETAMVTPFGPCDFIKMSSGVDTFFQTFQRFIDQMTTRLFTIFAHIDGSLFLGKSGKTTKFTYSSCLGAYWSIE